MRFFLYLKFPEFYVSSLKCLIHQVLNAVSYLTRHSVFQVIYIYLEQAVYACREECSSKLLPL